MDQLISRLPGPFSVAGVFDPTAMHIYYTQDEDLAAGAFTAKLQTALPLELGQLPNPFKSGPPLRQTFPVSA